MEEDWLDSQIGVEGSVEGLYPPPRDPPTLSPGSEAVSGFLHRLFIQNGRNEDECVGVQAEVGEEVLLH